ncbi:hypothetical protein [Halomontanus rarus]|uniref:hypothetical protein n=1 Tax=Halomontanus rarus TaxID=3034020 RepID=UPI0023E84B4C|nr:hypothetical protein [Halovivax sp. TS33]
MTQTHSSGERRRTELAELRRELRDKQSYLNDGREDLWEAISQWLLESHNVPIGSLRTMVRTELASLQDDPLHKMYDHPEVDDGTEAFPDKCKTCPHYGVQCPVLARHVSKQTLERIFDEADDDDELQAGLSPYAAKHHCHVIQDTISEWETGYAEFLSRGERLRILLNADIKGIDLDDLDGGFEIAFSESGETADSTPTNPTAGLDGLGLETIPEPDGPPPEDAQRIAEVTDALMNDEEEGEA